MSESVFVEPTEQKPESPAAEFAGAIEGVSPGPEYLAYFERFNAAEERVKQLHEANLFFARVSFTIGIALTLLGTVLAFCFADKAWAQLAAFKDPSKVLAEYRNVLIAFISFKASLVGGLFTTGGLLMKGAQAAARQPGPEPAPPEPVA